MTSENPGVVCVFEPADPAFFAAFVAASAELANELRFKASAAGVECVGFDPGVIAVVEWRLGAEYFRRLDAAELVVFDVAGPDFARALRGLEGKDGLKVSVAGALVAVDVEREGSRLRRTFPRMEYSPHGRIPKLALGVLNACISARGFQAAVAEVADAAERADLGVGGGALLFSAEDDLKHSSHVAITPLNPGETVSGAGRGRYSVEYLKRVAKLAPKFAMIKLSWGETVPLEAVYEFPGAWARYVVAPVVQNE